MYTAGGETLHFDLTYRFVPGEPDDGVTVHVPVPLLAGLQPTGFEWLVPGMREDLVTELIRSLPKQVRRHVVPAPDYARRVVPLLDSRRTESLRAQLAAALTEVSGHVISPEEFRFDSLPAHLRMLFAAVDRRGKIIDSDKDLSALKRRRATQIQSSVSQAGRRVEQDSVSEWTADTLGTIPSGDFHEGRWAAGSGIPGPDGNPGRGGGKGVWDARGGGCVNDDGNAHTLAAEDSDPSTENGEWPAATATGGGGELSTRGC